MNWKYLRHVPWLDTRAAFVSAIARRGTLLDVGASDGETLGHFAELRPDLQLRATDLVVQPGRYPRGCDVHAGDITRDPLPWPSDSVDAITCLQVVEHLDEIERGLVEMVRVLRPGGRIMIETPDPSTTELPSAKQHGFTLNFYDDPTHVKPVPVTQISHTLEHAGCDVLASGTSRNWLFAASYGYYWFRQPSRRSFTAYAHLLGWSTYVVAMKR